MGIPDGATHLVISGVSAGTEGWAFGWWLDDPNDMVNIDLDTGSIPFNTFRSALLAAMSADQSITAYDTYHYVSGVLATHKHKDVSHPGTASSGALPLSVSCVLTLRTATLSRRGRGRVYLPTCSSVIMSGVNHLFSSSVVNGLVDAFAGLLSAEAAGGDFTPVVVSRVGTSMHPVTSVDADLVPDVQRRRTAQQSTGRHSASV